MGKMCIFDLNWVFFLFNQTMGYTKCPQQQQMSIVKYKINTLTQFEQQ